MTLTIADPAADIPAADRTVTSADNKPPLTPRESHALNISDLLLETANWCDGSPIENEAQAGEVQTLMRLLQEASEAADEQRKLEKAPLDKRIAEIQDYWNPLIAPLTNKKPGTVSVAVQACQNALTAWLRAQRVKADAEALEARRRADAAALAAQQALEAARASSDIGARDEAEKVVDQARHAETVANQAEKAKPRVEGMGRATGLRDSWTVKGFSDVEGPDGVATPGTTVSFRWFWANRRDALTAALLDLARDEVRRGRREIPGIEIKNEPRV